MTDSLEPLVLSLLLSELGEVTPSTFGDLPEPFPGEQLIGQAPESVARITALERRLVADSERPSATRYDIALNKHRMEMLRELKWAEIMMSLGERSYSSNGIGIRKGGAIVLCTKDTDRYAVEATLKKFGPKNFEQFDEDQDLEVPHHQN